MTRKKLRKVRAKKQRRAKRELETEAIVRGRKPVDPEPPKRNHGS